MLNVLFMLLPVGGACRARVILKLSKSFSSPIDASKKFEEICKTLFFTPQVSPIPIKTVVNPIMASSSNPIAGSSSGSSLEIASHDPLLDRIMQLSLDEQLWYLDLLQKDLQRSMMVIYIFQKLGVILLVLVSR